MAPKSSRLLLLLVALSAVSTTVSAAPIWRRSVSNLQAFQGCLGGIAPAITKDASVLPFKVVIGTGFTEGYPDIQSAVKASCDSQCRQCREQAEHESYETEDCRTQRKACLAGINIVGDLPNTAAATQAGSTPTPTGAPNTAAATQAGTTPTPTGTPKTAAATQTTGETKTTSTPTTTPKTAAATQTKSTSTPTGTPKTAAATQNNGGATTTSTPTATPKTAAATQTNSAATTSPTPKTAAATDATNTTAATGGVGGVDPATGETLLPIPEATEFCKGTGQAAADGTQIKTGFCASVGLGQIPAVEKMISTVVIEPANGAELKAGDAITIKVKVQNMATGFFSVADSEYYTQPQKLDDQGNVKGHVHVTVQNMGDGQNPPDANIKAFFKGLNDKAQDDGTLSTEVPAGTIVDPGTYRICTLTGTFSHQPALMPVAQRGAQDDCIRVTVA